MRHQRKAVIDPQRPPISFEEYRAAFLARPEIAALSEEEQEKGWAERYTKVRAFWEALAGVACFAIVPDAPANPAADTARRRQEP